MVEKISIACKIDEDIDKVGSMRCDVSKNGKKIGDFNVHMDTEKGKFSIEIKGKELIKNLGQLPAEV